MSKIVKRGSSNKDEKEFDDKSIEKLYKAGGDLYYLLSHGYNVKSASTFVGNHYLLSERQRLALARAVSPKYDIDVIRVKEVTDELVERSVVNIDGFNTIITLEVALSGSVLLKCMDGTIRDLAGLRGTYSLIDKTDLAIKMIGDMLEKNNVAKANFYLDAPVSNSGRLKQRILELLSEFSFEVQVENINDVDRVLQTLDNVITSDAIILDKCKSWINLNRKIIESNVNDYHYVDFSKLTIC